MGRLKLSENLFLEVAELNRQQKFLVDDYKRLFKHIIKSPGIANDGQNTYFKVSAIEGSNSSVLVNAGIAFDSDMNAIIMNEAREVEVNNAGGTQWIILQRGINNDEIGTVSVNGQGIMMGTNTEFTSVLRGQPNFPTKVRFSSSVNTGEYEVIEVTSDTTAILSGDFVAENNLKYQVIGTFTPGFIPEEENKLIYEYDGCQINVIESDYKPELNEGQLLLASITFTQGIINVADERINNMFDSDNDNIISTTSDPLVALRKTTLINNILDIQFEWGYKVIRYDVTISSTNNLFTILDGESKYIGNNSISDNIFAGWKLINLDNMISVDIDSNTGSILSISKFNPDIVSENADFVIVPQTKNIEIEVRVVNDSEDVKSTNLFNIDNQKNRIFLPLIEGRNEIHLKYRLLGNNNATIYRNFANSYFINQRGEEETLGQSSFIVDVESSSSVLQNYS